MVSDVCVPLRSYAYLKAYHFMKGISKAFPKGIGQCKSVSVKTHEQLLPSTRKYTRINSECQ